MNCFKCNLIVDIINDKLNCGQLTCTFLTVTDTETETVAVTDTKTIVTNDIIQTPIYWIHKSCYYNKKKKQIKKIVYQTSIDLKNKPYLIIK